VPIAGIITDGAGDSLLQYCDMGVAVKSELTTFDSHYDYSYEVSPGQYDQGSGAIFGSVDWGSPFTLPKITLTFVPK
jgi:hypothetical protein